MEDNAEEFEPLVSRLRAFGDAPVPLATTSRVLATARGTQRTSFFRSTKLKVAAGIAGGFLVGSIGFASADMLPATAQEAAHDALGAVGVHVPPGHDRYNGPECGDAKNHGDYVSSHPDDPNAAKSDCGKPKRSLNHENKGKSEEDHGKPADAGESDGNGKSDEDHGKPDDAGNGNGKSDEDHGKPDDAGNGNGKSDEDHGKPDDAGKPADAGGGKPDDAGRPATAGNATSADHQDEHATTTTTAG